MNSDEKIAVAYLKANNYRKTKGFAISSDVLRENNYTEIFYEGEDLFSALEGYVRIVEYWINDDCWEKVAEDIWDAVDCAEAGASTSYEDFKKKWCEE